MKYLIKAQFYSALKTKKNYSLSKEFGVKVESIKNDRLAWIYDGQNIILLLTVGDHEIVE